MSRRHSVSILPKHKPHRVQPRREPRRKPMQNRRMLYVLGGTLLLLLGWFGWNTVEQRVVYVLNQYTPASVHGIWNTADQSRVKWTTKCPPVIPGVHAAKWAGGWDTPRLRKPVGKDLGPAILLLHIFSIPNTASRKRRELIRDHHPLFALPEEYRHLVEVKFVLGYPKEECRNEALCPGVAEEEAEIEKESRHGDLIRLEGLKNGENMDEGKTWEWIRHVGREGGREAHWVFKCDDDVSTRITTLIDPSNIAKSSPLPALAQPVRSYLCELTYFSADIARSSLARRIFLPYAGLHVRYELGRNQNPRFRHSHPRRHPISPSRGRPYFPTPPLVAANTTPPQPTPPNIPPLGYELLSSYSPSLLVQLV